jgi:hypothetical protein
MGLGFGGNPGEVRRKQFYGDIGASFATAATKSCFHAALMGTLIKGGPGSCVPWYGLAVVRLLAAIEAFH